MTQPAPVICAGDGRARFRRAVAAHFSGRISPPDERALREHLPECTGCRRFYDRARLLSGIDPRALKARERLARGLGLPGRGTLRGALTSPARAWTWALPVLAAMALFVVRLASPVGSPPEPAPRGVASVAAPALLAYRIPPHGMPRAVDDAAAIAGHDELAFAYTNPGGWPYVMVFALDEHGHVYWYHPAWRLNGPPPVAIPARAGTGPFELPSATRHAFDGRRLIVHAVFARRSIGVEEIERAVQAAGEPGRLALPGDVQVVRRSFAVAP